MRLALAQLNVVVGDVDGNVARLTGAIAAASRAGADLVVLPELAVTGYPPEDLLLRPGFVRAAREAVDEVARACTDTVALVGAPAFERDLANAAFVCADGAVAGGPGCQTSSQIVGATSTSPSSRRRRSRPRAKYRCSSNTP